MHLAVDALKTTPELLLIDGNRFKNHVIPHQCIVKGDGKTYKFRFREGYRSTNYSSNFNTIKNEWLEIEI